MNTLRTLLPTLLLTLLVGSLPALAGDLAKEPGYLDLEWIEIPADAAEIQDINLGPALLAMALGVDEQATEPEELALAEALKMVRSIRVKSYSLEAGHGERTAKAIGRIEKQLAKDGWDRLFHMRDHDETITLSTLSRGGTIVGLAAVVFEPGDSVTFANVVGDLNLGTLMKLAGQLEEGDLGDLLEGLDIEVERSETLGDS